MLHNTGLLTRNVITLSMTALRFLLKNGFPCTDIEFILKVI